MPKHKLFKRIYLIALLVFVICFCVGLPLAVAYGL